MSVSRLTLALNGGDIALPDEGRIGVFRAGANFDLSALAPERVHVVQGFLPDHQIWARRGITVSVAAEGPYAAVIISMTRSKDEARALVALARSITDGPIVIDGQKSDGIEGMLRDIRKRTVVGAVLSKAHGKIFSFSGGDFADWTGQERAIGEGFVTCPGVFSADGIDAGSAALVRALPAGLSGRVADLGAGWGYLARHVLTRPAVTSVDLIEADHTALTCARKNVTDPRANFLWEDATQFQARAPYDVVLSNPPFHTGRAPDPALGQAFIATAAEILTPRGTLYMVANRHLPYEATLDAHFAQLTELAGDRSFKIFAATKPRRIRR